MSLVSKEYLNRIKEEINLFNIGNSNLIYYDKYTFYNTATKTVHVKEEQNKHLMLYGLVHELDHFFQSDIIDEEEIKIYNNLSLKERMETSIEFNANVMWVRYLYFIEELNHEKIIKINRDIGLFSCAYLRRLFNFLDIDDTVEDELLSIKIFTKKYDVDETEGTKQLVSFMNFNNEDVAHISVRDKYNLWYGFHDGNDWVDFIIIDVFDGNIKEIEIRINRESRDEIFIDGYRFCSHYHTKNKQYIDKIDRIKINSDLGQVISKPKFQKNRKGFYYREL